MNVSLFLTKPQKQPKSRLEEITLRGFGGGWNVIDEDTNMEAKYQPDLVNFRRTPSGAQKLRFGSKVFANVSPAITGNIIDMEYFNNRLVVVSSTGQIATIDSAGAVVAVWNPTIAGALPVTPPDPPSTGWSATSQVDFVHWKEYLIIHNGIDKPLIMNASYVFKFLTDPASGSVFNVPIGKYGCIAANFHCVGGISGYPTTVYISSKGTSGTFPGDGAPNNAISIDVGAYAPSGAPLILGLAGYRQFLIVFFRGASLIVKLGVFDASDPPKHIPEFIDEMPQFGLINHRCIVTVENDLRFAGYDGMASAKRNLFSGNIDSKFLSELIEPAWREDLPTVLTMAPFMVFNPIDHCTYMFTNDSVGTTYVFQSQEQLKYSSWTRYEGTGLRMVCGCKSFLGRVYVAGHVNARTTVYQLGNDIFPNEEFHADLQTTTDPNTGTAINFLMELPWVDGRTPMRVKQLRFMSIDSRGTAPFRVDAYIDFNAASALFANYVGNDAGAGVKSNDPQLYGFPLKFKTVKVKITGSAKEPLIIAGIRYLFSKGRFRR
jgi:hypothetical protein